jgi:hypothetical protein
MSGGSTGLGWLLLRLAWSVTLVVRLAVGAIFGKQFLNNVVANIRHRDGNRGSSL